MRIFTRLVLVAALLYLGFVLFQEGRVQQSAENADQTKIILYFAGVILVALFAGTIVALSLVPAIGDWVGHLLVSPDEKIEHDPHMDAQAKIAQGDYHGAISIFLQIFESDHTDTHALNEAVRLYIEKLGDVESGATLLENALQEEWPPEQSAFLANRLVDIYWNYQADGERSRALLMQIIETMPSTKYSANAQHRLHEIDRAVLEGNLPTPPQIEDSGEAEAEA